MKKILNFTENERMKLSTALSKAGAKIEDCENFLRSKGFNAFDIVQDLHKKIADSESEIREYSQFKAERGMEALGSFNFPGSNNISGDNVRSKFLDEQRKMNGFIGL